MAQKMARPKTESTGSFLPRHSMSVIYADQLGGEFGGSMYIGIYGSPVGRAWVIYQLLPRGHQWIYLHTTYRCPLGILWKR